jgi:DNA-binding CsgD family transcriptional regulator
VLTERDLRAVLELAGEVHDVRDLHEFRVGVLPVLKRVVPAEIASYNELDAQTRPIATVSDPELPPSAHEAWARYAWQNPLVQRYARTRDGRPFRWSDVVDMREFRRTEVFRELYGPYGLDHQIAFTLPSPPQMTIGIALMRSDPDYTERERQILQLARPHLIQAYRHAELRESLASLLDSARRGLDAAHSAVVVVAASGEVMFVTAAARELAALAGAGEVEIARPLGPPLWAGDDDGGRPPRPLESLPLPDGDTLLVRRAQGDRGETALVLARGSRALSVAALRGLGLTPGEAAVLHALARGRTTNEVADELAISPRTIHKHMQRVNAKLGVRERGQAIATAWAAAGT